MLQKERLFRMCSKWMNMSMSLAFDTWHANAVHLAHIKRVGERILTKWANQRLFACLETWSFNAAHQSKIEKIASRVLSGWINRRLNAGTHSEKSSSYQNCYLK
jgi:hypothetical protein